MMVDMKKILLVICFMFILFSMSCGVFKQYEDTNGDDDYTLQSITDEMLIKDSGGLQVGAITSTSSKNGITNISLKVHRFDGVNEIYKIKSGSYTMTVNFKVTSGNAKLVVTDGKRIVKTFNISEEDQVFEFTSTNSYYFKMAGEACEFELTAEIKNK